MKLKNFYLTDENCAELERRAKAAQVSEAQCVRDWLAGGLMVEPPHPGPAVVDPEIHAMVVEADKAIPNFPPSKPLSREEREELTDAAQRRMAQSRKGKK